MTFRTYNTFTAGINNVPITVANLMDIASIGTDWAATLEARSSYEFLPNSIHWMSFLNTETGVVHWDYVRQVFLGLAVSMCIDFLFIYLFFLLHLAIGHMISIPVADYQ